MGVRLTIVKEIKWILIEFAELHCESRAIRLGRKKRWVVLVLVLVLDYSCFYIPGFLFFAMKAARAPALPNAFGS